MGVRIPLQEARDALEAAAREGAPADPEWIDRIQAFSSLIQSGGHPATHIAFLGTAILARTVRDDVDVLAIKEDAGPQAYSARGLCHGALVPASVPLGVSLGVSGREPLNNQPYFRESRVSERMPVRAGTRPVLEELMRLLDALSKVASTEEARAVLGAYIVVRRRYVSRRLQPVAIEGDVDPGWLAERIAGFVAERSEGGRRAQAVAAGLVDVFAEPGRVVAGRINDPDRHLPGDVGVRSVAEEDAWEKVIEVRDKRVAVSDLHAFAGKCLEAGAREALVLSVSGTPTPDPAEAVGWAADRGLSLTVYDGWSGFVREVLLWSEEASPVAAAVAIGRILERLGEVEASSEAIEAWRAVSEEAARRSGEV